MPFSFDSPSLQIVTQGTYTFLSFNMNTSEKLCLQWNDFKENATSSFANLREDKDLTDVTLASEDGRQVEAHKVILAASSSFFETILKKNKHSHPLIFMRGMKTIDLVALVDFLYFGEAKVFQENLDSFLAIAEELQLKGLQGSKDQNELAETKFFPPSTKLVNEMSHITSNSGAESIAREITTEAHKNESSALVTPKTKIVPADMQDLDITVKSMMETSQSTIMDGSHQKKAKICKICGKEGPPTAIKNHIEANHLEGISVPCNFCEKFFRSRNAKATHVSLLHRGQQDLA